PQVLCALFLLQTARGQPAESTAREQLRQWLMANSNSIPQGAKEAISMAAASEGNDLASAILKIFGFGSEKQFKPIEATLQPLTTSMTPRNGAKISERDGSFQFLSSQLNV
uniref:Uncharacterized protein n=1 Tax=Parascaris univalens TaxID=6257 RepID=A0A915ARL2_PARUN